MGTSEQTTGASPLEPLAARARAGMERDGGEVPDEGPLRAPWDARITFESALARARRGPALHPVWTTSRWLHPDFAGVEHCRVAETARALLARWRELDPALGAVGGDPDVARARRLQDWLAQPFLVSEAFSGRLGDWLAPAHLLAAARAIVDGEREA
jgi:F-type H+-transporting ATPase subunit beta